MKKLLILSVILVPGAVFAQSANRPAGPDLSYSYAELRFVDADNGGDGLRLYGSYDLGNRWIILGGITDLDYNQNVDQFIVEFGGGYVYPYAPDWDLVATARIVDSNVDTPGGDFDDTGVALSAGTRGLIAPKFEVRGSVNYINLDNSDTYLEVAADYHFSQSFSAGASAEVAGDNDLFTVGIRWYFR
jgi:hypothetical protein